MMGTKMGKRSVITLAAGALCAFAAQGQAPAAAATGNATAQPASTPHVYGHIEHALVTVSPPIEVQAQLDGGGDSTVLLVQDLKYASGEGGMFVHFTIDNGQVMPGRTVNVALPVLKDLHVHDRDGGTVHQPVVAMSFCIGDHAFTTNVTLKPRTTFTPPLVLGKADAAQFGAIDPTKKNTLREASCAAPAATPAPAAH